MTFWNAFLGVVLGMLCSIASSYWNKINSCMELERIIFELDWFSFHISLSVMELQAPM